MQIELEFEAGKDNNKKTEKRIFVVGKVKARMVRKATIISAKADFNNLKTEILDEMVDFLCEVYANQFTLDELYDGIDSDVLIPKLIETVQGITTGVTERLEKFPQE